MKQNLATPSAASTPGSMIVPANGIVLTPSLAHLYVSPSLSDNTNSTVLFTSLSRQFLQVHYIGSAESTTRCTDAQSSIRFVATNLSVQHVHPLDAECKRACSTVTATVK
jgi:hypothetical protein